MVRTLWDVLGSIADQRGRKGRQFPLQAILAIAIAAMLAGANDLRDFPLGAATETGSAGAL
jgi:MFS-type transporter involved in bile tolerance (Atg22 family)